METGLSFGNWVRRRRRALDLTREALAAAAGCSVSALRKIETDTLRPSKPLADALADSLGIPPQERDAFIRFARDTVSDDEPGLPIPTASTPLPSPPHRGPFHLPIPLTPLIGREQAVAALERLILRDDVRLVTVTGPGGVGKTRLAVQVAATMVTGDDEGQPPFPDGVFFVNLAPISDTALVSVTIAQSLGIRDMGDRPVFDSLKEFVRDKSLLMLLDNFEQVVETTGVVADLLAHAPGLKVLVTSRARLRVQGEHSFLVPPLTTPDPEHIPPLKVLAQEAAVQLFVQRAQQVRADFALTPDNAMAVAQLCHRLDGLPLAIELAAARITVLSPQAMLARSASRLTWLKGGGRDQTTRQQTLRHAIAWSYDLLDATEQTLLRHLAVFVGGFTLDAADVVCLADSGSPSEALDGIESLISKSLLYRTDEVNGEVRFGMLETIREYALERLVAADEEVNVRDRHLAYFLSLAEDAERHDSVANETVLLKRLDRDFNDLRAALHWAAERQPATQLRLASALGRFWSVQGYWREGRGWLEDALRRVGPSDTPRLRAQALFKAAHLAVRTSEYAKARSLLDESLKFAQASGDHYSYGHSLFWLGFIAHRQGDTSTARSLFEQSLSVAQELGDTGGVAYSLDLLGLVVSQQGEHTLALALHHQSLALRRELGDAVGIARSLHNLGMAVYRKGDASLARTYLEESLTLGREVEPGRVHQTLAHLSLVVYSQGELPTATALAEESLAGSRKLGDMRGVAEALVCLGRIRRASHDYATAHSLFTESLAISRQAGNKLIIAACLAGLADVALGLGNPERAAQLVGAADALCIALGVATVAFQPPTDHDRIMAAARTALDDARFTLAWAAGQGMPLEDAVNFALEHDPRHGRKWGG